MAWVWLVGLSLATATDPPAAASAVGAGAHTLHQRVPLQLPLPPLSLQVLEERWAALDGSIEELRAERAEALAAVVEAEREVMVWERRVQLEKEMQVRLGSAQQWCVCGGRLVGCQGWDEHGDAALLAAGLKP